MPSKNELNASRTRFLNENREVVWSIKEDGTNVADHIEMSGFMASAIISYGSDKNGKLLLMRHLTVPKLRMKPNLTGSSFSCNFSGTEKLSVNGQKTEEYPETISIKGNLKIQSETNSTVSVTREFLPAVRQPVLIEIVTVKNHSDKTIRLAICAEQECRKTAAWRCEGSSITAGCSLLFDDAFEISQHRAKHLLLQPDEEVVYYRVYYAYQDNPIEAFSLKEEINARKAFIDEMFSSLQLETPFPELDAQFSHCILRGSESIFQTKNGLMHAPGGGNYYAALWTNDQCEYANPFFPFSGYKAGIEQSINCYSLYEAYMDKSALPMQDKKALVTSIIAEGTDYWNGAGDRGDGEMYAYGISRFLLEMSDTALIKRFWESLV